MSCIRFNTPEDVFAHDPSPTMRSLVAWKASLAAEYDPAHA
jgi:hypothetical protein